VLFRSRGQAAELGREDHAPASGFFQEAADQLFIVADPIEVRGIEEVDALIERALHRLHRLGFIGGPIGLRHPNTTEAKRGNGLAGTSKRRAMHVIFLSVRVGFRHDAFGGSDTAPSLANRANRMQTRRNVAEKKATYT